MRRRLGAVVCAPRPAAARRCPAATSSSGRRRRVSSSHRSAASIRPPPSTTTSGSSTATRLATPSAVHQANSAMTASASGSPAAGAGDHVLAADGRLVAPDRGRARASRRPGLGRVPGHAGQAGARGVALPAPALARTGTGGRWGRPPCAPAPPPCRWRPAATWPPMTMPAADAGAQRDEDDVARALRGARDVLGPHRAVAVVVDDHAVAQPVDQSALHVQLDDAGLVRPVPQHAPVVDEAGHPDPRRGPRRRARLVLGHLTHDCGDAVEQRLGAPRRRVPGCTPAPRRRGRGPPPGAWSRRRRPRSSGWWPLASQ